MRYFTKSLLYCLGWLVISELLCLVLSFSFAILHPDWIRWLSLICGAMAHALLMGNAGRNIAAKDTAEYRVSGKRRPVLFSLLLAIGTAIPLWLLWVILTLLRNSSAALNVFLLLNAPFIQFHRLILDGAEPFSAVSAGRQMIMALPPLLTVFSVFIGYQLHYQKTVAEIASRSHRT